MNELLKERLISLLSDASQVTNEEMQSAYGKFIAYINGISQDEKQPFHNTLDTNALQIKQENS